MLHQVERHAFTSEQHDALKNSRTTLHFIVGRGEAGAFEEFFESFDTAPLLPVLTFATKEEADTWLRNHPSPPHGAIIGALNELYTVAYIREPDFRKLLRIPSREELAQMDDAEDEDEPGNADETAPPSPIQGMRFSFFDFFKWTCFHLHELEQRISSPQELEAIGAARISLDFVMHVGEHHGFEEYLESIHSARASGPLQFFATREEADTWLNMQPEPPPPTVVAIGSELYSVGYHRLRALRVLIRIPTQQELRPGAP
ncbi:hypothetical protein [Vitiosangium sp. GDMCC 1.1324]|uniref:hypothetical protein n=1 Tax=Vitiosangium sp. (strain GDMCC 1.1324) TaxID=2138576 RepID=UPI0011B4D1A5|nr:hypothetical protein [Vitiosangium sp. GDMCC 1.1324]